MVGFLYRYRKYLTFAAMFRPHESQSREKNIENGRHISPLELTNHHFPNSTEFESIYVALFVMNSLAAYNPFQTEETLLDSRYSMAMLMENFRANYYPLFYQSKHS